MSLCSVPVSMHIIIVIHSYVCIIILCIGISKFLNVQMSAILGFAYKKRRDGLLFVLKLFLLILCTSTQAMQPVNGLYFLDSFVFCKQGVN